MPSSLHRMSDNELPAVLSLLSASGATARSRESWSHDRMTALLLGPERSPTAAMPLAQRAIATAPGRTIYAGWLSGNQFASRMSLRRQTRDTASDWPRLLPELDALFVMRRDESSLAGRWYAQTGFCDVLSIRCLYLDMTSPPASHEVGGVTSGASGRYQAQVVTPAEGQWDAPLWQSQMLGVYRDVFGSFGGTPTRSADYWRRLLANHYYRDHYQFQIIGLWTPAGARGEEKATLMGYAVVGWTGWHSKRPRMDILELATRQWDTAVAADLIRTTCQLAWSKQVRQVRAVISAHDPYRGHLTRTGFVDRWGYTMQAKCLNAQRYLDRLAETLPAEVGNFWLNLAVPGEVPLVVGRGPRSAPATSITLQADARSVTRLLLNRLDLSSALQEGAISSATALSEQDATRLSICFPWTPWAFHMIDYI